MNTLARLLLLLIALTWCLALTQPLAACPGCKEGAANAAEEADETEDLPWNPAHAYSYSVLFMLGVPAALLASFGTAFYVLSRKQPHFPISDDPSHEQAQP